MTHTILRRDGSATRVAGTANPPADGQAPEWVEVVISGDWNLTPEDRYSEAYPALWAQWTPRTADGQAIMGYPGDFYGTPDVVQAVVARIDALTAYDVATHEPSDAPRLTWDGTTLTVEEAGETTTYLLGETVPGYVHLPLWGWGPLEVDEFDELKPAPVGYEATCGTCGETYNPETPRDLVHGMRDGGSIECGGAGTLTGWWY